MDSLTEHLIVISLDGLGTVDFEFIRTLPNFRIFLKEASYSKKVYSIYPTLTYPAHATIVTGKYPKNHGIVSNTLMQPGKVSPDWYWSRRYIKGDTLYDLAIEKGMKVAALLWPTTAKSKIQYNMPEIFANRPWSNQVIVSLLNGSPLYQFVLSKKFGSLRSGKTQPNLDNFVHESLLYTIRTKGPELVLAHYTDLDTTRHIYGFNSVEAQNALIRHDKRLGEIILTLKENKMYDSSTIVLLGDHSSLDEDMVISPNVILRERGYIDVKASGRVKDYRAIAKNCDGSCYIYLRNKEDASLVKNIYSLLKDFKDEFNCIDDIYTRDEAIELGADPECSFMLEASFGYYFSDSLGGKVIKHISEGGEGAGIHGFTKAAHGYSPFKENYTTVFMASGRGIKKGVELQEMRLIDEGPTLARLLGVKLKETDGRILEEFLE